MLVIGIPGAGKSTLIARAVRPSGAMVLDTDPLRRRWAAALAGLPYGLWRPFLHAAHLASIWGALGRPGGPVVIGEPGTRPFVRALMRRRAERSGRPLHLLGIDATAEEARAGQLQRRRTIRSASLERHARRWERLRRRAPNEGYASVSFLSRSEAGSVAHLSFASPAARREIDAATATAVRARRRSQAARRQLGSSASMDASGTGREKR